jgi:CHAD domain-containing protein
VRDVLDASVARLIAHEPAVRKGEDPEAVHQARVATRRLRSDLRTFGDLLDADWARSLREELAWLGEALGTVRDADVLLERLRDTAARLPEPDRRVADGVLTGLEVDRDQARAALLDAMDERRYHELIGRLQDAGRAPRLTSTAAAPAVEVLPALVLGPWQALARAVEDLGSSPPDEALHGVRKRAKRVRYAAEAAAPLAGKRARRFAKALANVQDVLGDHQDAVVAEHWLRGALRMATPRQTFVIGQLAAMERAEADASRAAWRTAWTGAARKRLRTWI